MGEAHKLDRHYRYTKQAFSDNLFFLSYFFFDLMFSDHKKPGGDSLREVSARGLCERSLREVSARGLCERALYPRPCCCTKLIFAG